MSDALEAWGDVWKRGYAIPDSVAEIMVDLRRSVDVDKTRNYLARLNGETVGISMLVMGGKVEGIYYVVPIPEFRGQGIGTAVTLFPLKEAQKMRYKVAFLLSTKMGYRVYKRNGFKECYKIANYLYLWTPDLIYLSKQKFINY